MKKYVISLPRRQDRKDLFIDQNTNLTDWEWYEAVDGEQLDRGILKQNGMALDPTWRDPFNNRKMTKGEVGCFLSHRKLWHECYSRQEPIMILEDDAIILDTFDEQYYESLTEQYDLIYLQRNENKPEEVEPIDDMIEKPAFPYNLTAYILTPKCAEILMKTRILSKMIPVDDYVPQMLPHINACALKENSVKASHRDITSSDIEPSYNNNWMIDFNTHVLTFGKSENNNMLDSCAVKSIYPIRLGVEHDSNDEKEKIKALLEQLELLPEYDVVVYTDPNGILFNSDLQDIANEYLNFNSDFVCSCIGDKPNLSAFMGQVNRVKEVLGKIGEVDIDAVLDTEQKLFHCGGEIHFKNNGAFWNIEKDVIPKIYQSAGNEYKAASQTVLSRAPDLWIPNYKGIDIIDKDMFVIDFMTQSQCDNLIEISDRHGEWGSLSYDKFPAKEIRLKSLGQSYWDDLERHWDRHVNPLAEQFWRPLAMYGLRDAFTMRYSVDTQKKLNLHTDASLVTGSVKLNDDYEGAILNFPRQGVTNEHIPVGKAIIFPGQVTHGHECTELISGVKYSLTMWTSRYYQDLV